MAKAECIVRQSNLYTIVGSTLYKRSAHSAILMKCIYRVEGINILDKIHSGDCGNHAASRNVIEKALRSGFYWPTALADTKHVV